MVARIVTLLLTLTVVVPVCAQTTTLPVSSEFPYVAEVTGTNVNVRSRPQMNVEFQCTQLSRPDKVTVVGRQGEWLEILPPAGCFGAISKAYVQVDATGKAGTVTGDNVRVYAGGDLRPANFVTPQTRLNKGDAVQVLGESGEYYKITSPKGVSFYVNADFVRRPGEAAPIGRMTSTSRAADATLVTRYPAASQGVSELPTAPLLAAVQEAQKIMEAEFRKPLDQRDLKSVLAKFQAIEVPPESSLRPVVEARILLLQNAIKQMEDAKDISKAVAETDVQRKQFELERAKIEAQQLPPEPVRYAAQGVLSASQLFPGGPAAPARYVLRDSDGNITAYAQCASGAVDLAQYAGKRIGVLGTKQYDKDLEVDVVEAKDVVVVDAVASLPSGPAQPTLKFPNEIHRPEPKPGAPTPGSSPAPATNATAPGPAPRPPVGEVKPEAASQPAQPRFMDDAPPPKPASKPTTAASGPVEPAAPTGLGAPRPTSQPAKATLNEKEYK